MVEWEEMLVAQEVLAGEEATASPEGRATYEYCTPAVLHKNFCSERFD